MPQEIQTTLVRIAQAFSCFPETGGITALGQGHINDTFLAKDGGRGEAIVLQRINHNVFLRPRAVVANQLLLYRHLKAQETGLLLPKPLPCGPGNYLMEDSQGQYWRATTYLADTFSMETVSVPETIHAVAKTYGNYVRALSSLDAGQLQDTIPHFHHAVLRSRQLAFAASHGLAERRKEAAFELQCLRQYQGIFIRITRLTLPVRAVHNDAKMGNILFRCSDQKPCAVIDWDTTMRGSILSDFGDMVRTIAATCPEDDPRQGVATIDSLRFEALAAGWMDGVGAVLTPQERENLLLGAHWLILEQAMRFLTDYLLGDKYYKINHPAHNLDRTRNQLDLYQSLLEQESALLRFIKG